MWKVCRKTIFPRWHRNRQTSGNRSKDVKIIKLSPAQDERSKSYGDRNEKQHAHKQQSRFWDDPQFQCNSLRSNLLETVGFVGTAVALCLDIQHRHCKSPYQYEDSKGSCLFSKVAFAMPYSLKNKILANETTVSSINKEILSSTPDEPNTTGEQNREEKDIDSILKDMEDLTIDYIAIMENSAGMEYLKKDKKQAFQFFKASAQHGCPKGLFNLALCYEIGSGVDINLEKAAFYYEKAASKGHVIATYNLGIFYVQGLGGLPKDFNKGIKQITKAAKCGFPQALLFLGVQYLDQEKWELAYTMFKDAASQNCIESKYYLGLCYENGWGVSKNETIAADMYSEAASKGHENATLNLGNFYQNGQGGIPKDPNFAMALYKIIADKGHNDGKKALHALRNKLNPPLKIQDLKSCDIVSETAARVKVKQCSLHTSISVPELRNSSFNSLPVYKQIQSTSNYLDLIHPVIPLRHSSKLNETSFCIGSEDVNPTTVELRHLQHSIPHILAA